MQSKLKTTLIYFWSFIALGMIAGLIGPSLPSFATNTGSTLKHLSNLFLLSSMGYLVGSYGVGRFLNKVKGHLVLSVSLVCMAIFVGLMPIIRELWLLVAVFFFLGIAQSSLDVAENTLIIWLHGSQVTAYMNGLHFFFGVGTLIAPLIIAQSLRLQNNVSMALWVLAAFILIPAFFIIRQPSPSEIFQTPEQQADPERKSSMLLVVFLVVLFFGFVGAEVTFGSWIYTYSINSGHTNTQTAAYLSAAYWSAFTIGRLLGIWIARRISVRLMMGIDLVGALISIVVMLIFPHAIALLWIMTILFGFFIATTFPTGMNLAERLGVVSARVTSWFFISASLASMLSPWLVGQYIESIGPHVFMWIVAANLMVALGFYILIRVRQRPKSATTDVFNFNSSSV